MKLRELVLGAPKSPLDPKVFERLALAAFLAWVGLGADGLSSSCYGPEEIFVELGPHRALAPFLIAAIALTAGILSAGYAHTIEAFPGGGGGYTVASSTLGPYLGLLCGCALLVDYVLTIAISMASAMDALFSVLHTPSLQPWKLPATVVATLGLMTLNLRGVKESILVLLPIFVGFLATHTVAIVIALISHGSGVGSTLSASVHEAEGILAGAGWGGLFLILMKAFTVGAGTFTGIEAVSNSVPILREPRVATAKRAMLYMAISLAFTSGGLLLGYLLYDVAKVEGKTLNAVFFESLVGDTPFGKAFVWTTLATEGALLVVAAQAGYVDGPRVLASMAVDSWVPRWFRHLSDRLVISNGILLVGTGAIGAILLTGGRVQILVILYAFSVFVTFVLSQLGMCVHHLRHREAGWPGRLAINGVASLLSAVIASFMMVFRARHALLAGGVILGLMALCILVRRYYGRIFKLLGRLERVRTQIESEPGRGQPPPPRDPNAPTAGVLVRSYGGAGIHSFLTVLRLFPNYFRNFVFVSVGDIDFGRFKGTREVERLRASVQADLENYVALARKWGYWAEYRCALGVDVVDEVVKLCPLLTQEFPRIIFFAGHLVFEQPGFLTRLLHEQTAEEIQRRLQFKGHTLILLPIRVMAPVPRAAAPPA
jgi:amino acid transporter